MLTPVGRYGFERVCALAQDLVFRSPSSSAAHCQHQHWRIGQSHSTSSVELQHFTLNVRVNLSACALTVPYMCVSVWVSLHILPSRFKRSFLLLLLLWLRLGLRLYRFDLSAFRVNCPTAAFNVLRVHYVYNTSVAIGIVVVNVVFDSDIFRSMHKSMYKREFCKHTYIQCF